MLAKSQWLEVADIAAVANKGIGLSIRASDCLLLSLHLLYLCTQIAIPKWKTTTADALTLEKLAYPSVPCTSLLQQKMQTFTNAAAATLALLTSANRKKQYPKWSEDVTNTEKTFFSLCLVICWHLSWLGHDTVSHDFSWCFKGRYSEFAF